MMDKKKNVLLIHGYYYPDSPPSATILEEIRVFLKQKEFTVNVLSSKPSYKSVDKSKKFAIKNELDDGSVIYRLPVFKLSKRGLEKLLNFVWFPLAVFWFLVFHKKYDVISVSTAPQVLLAFGVALIAKFKGSKLIYHMMDIHPEMGKLSGEFRNPLVYKTLLWLDNFTCKNASKVLVLSEEMKATLIKRNQNFTDKIEIINNYNLSNHPLQTERYFDDDGIKRVVFAGNIGRFQNLDMFIKPLLAQGCIENFELIFVGEGVALKKLKALANSLKCVKFIPHQPLNIARKIIAEADLGIVSLQPSIIHYAYPSKTMTYLAEGTPLLVCVEPNTELVKFVEHNQLGLSVKHNDTQKLYNVYTQLASSTLVFDREHIVKTFEKHFSKRQFFKKYQQLLKDIGE